MKPALLAALLALPMLLHADNGARDDDAVLCEIEGGCVLVSREWIAQRLKAAFRAGQRSSQLACAGAT